MEYSEKHYISDWGIKVVFLVSAFTVFSLLMFTIATEYKAGSDETTELIIVSIIAMIIEVLVYLLIFNTTLKIRIANEGIHYKYKPFIWNEKLLRYSEITQWKKRKISPLGEFFGWGYRKNNRKKITGLVLKDGQGFEFIKSDGTTLIMTSENAELMAIALRKFASEKEIV
ncbi:MAG TPA: hypothetical protein VFM99_05315 [Chitinophagales bacterium]|nr:hypothetical protein [Chitinophagales bacterium]